MDDAPQDGLVVPFKKTKLAALVAVGMVMVGLSVLLAAMPEVFHRHLEWYVRAVGIVGTAFFGACLLIGVVKLFDSGPGLIVDRQGIVDRTSYIGVGRINWLEISGLRVVQVATVKYLAIDVRNPQHFIDRGNALQRFLKADSARRVGSPIAISNVALAADFDTLVDAIERHFREATGRR